MSSGPDRDRPRDDDAINERVESLVAWIDEIDARLRTAEAATGGEKAAKELRKAVEAVAKHDPKLGERLTDRVDVAADRLETLASAVATTSAAIAAKDGELVILRRELDAGLARMEALAADVRQTSRDRDIELRAAVDKLAADHAKRKRSEQDPEVGRKLAYLTERIDMLGTTVKESAAANVRREGELAQLRRETEAATARLGDALAQVRRDADSTPVVELRKRVDALTARERDVAALRAKVEERDARLTAAVKELRTAVTAVAEHVQAVRRDVDPDADAQLRERVAALEASPLTEVGDALATLEESLEAVGTRLADLEASASGKLAAVVHGTTEIRTELSEVGRRLAAIETETNDADDQRLDAIETALGTMRREATSRNEELEGLRGRMDSSMSRVDSLVADLQEALATKPPPAPTPSPDASDLMEAWEAEREWVRRQLGALAAMQGATFDPATELSVDLQQLAARVAALETEGVEPAADGAAGDGRLLVELRALERRLEQAETAAREGRESILAQLDRVASRIEWRLVQLEDDEGAASETDAPTSAAGLVVPIRSNDV